MVTTAPNGGEDLHHLLAQVGVICDGAQDGQEEHLQPDGKRDAVGEEGIRRDRESLRGAPSHRDRLCAASAASEAR